MQGKNELSRAGMARVENMLERLNKMIDLVDDAYAAMDLNLSTPIVELSDIRNAEEAENAINVYRDLLRGEHLSLEPQDLERKKRHQK